MDETYKRRSKMGRNIEEYNTRRPDHDCDKVSARIWEATQARLGIVANVA